MDKAPTNPFFHLDWTIIFTMKEIFLNCRISMCFPLLDIKVQMTKIYIPVSSLQI